MIWAVFRKELAVLWASPLPYVVGALFNAVTGLLYIDQLRGRQQALLQPLFPLAGFLLLLAVPVLAMRSFADERRTGSLDLLRAIPVPSRALVVGKWLAAWVMSVLVTVPTLAFAALVYRFGDPDSGPLVAGYLGLLLLMAAVAGVGVLASSLTSSQPVAAMVSLFTVLLLWFSQSGPEAVTVGSVLRHLSLSERLRSFAGGAVDSGDVVFLLALTAGTLAVAHVAVRRTPRTVAAAVVVLALLVAGDLAAHRDRAILDLTANDSLSLTKQTERVLAEVKTKTEISVFLPASDPDRSAAGPLLQRYERLSRHIKTSIKDPEEAQGEVRTLGLDAALGGVAVRQGDRVEQADTLTEQHITGAIVRLQRGRQRNLCASTGHGETSFADEGEDGLSEAGRILLSNGYLIQPIDLLASSTVPPGCDALVVANPVSALGEAGSVIAQYLAADGRVLVFADPVSDVDLSAVLGPYRIGVRRGLVIETDRQSTLPDDPTSPIIKRYFPAHPIARRVPPVLMPAVEGLDVGQDDLDQGLVVSKLAETSASSFLEVKPFAPQFTDGEDTPGPIVVAAAADKGRLEGEGAKRSRLVAFADLDFVTNPLVAEAGNATLLLHAVDWLTTNQDELVLSANLPPYRPLSLTAGQLAYARLLAAGIVPALFLLLGATVWALRRGR